MRQQVRIILNDDEMRTACHGAMERTLSRQKYDHIPRTQNRTKYYDEHWWQSDIVGAIAEYSVAKLLDLPWQWEMRDDKYDVGTYQVRSTEKPDNRLLLISRDDPSHNYIFCRVRANRTLIEGWINGQKVIDNDEKLYEDTWTISTYRLYPITDLPEFPQTLPKGCGMYQPPVKKLGTVT